MRMSLMISWNKLSLSLSHVIQQRKLMRTSNGFYWPKLMFSFEVEEIKLNTHKLNYTKFIIIEIIKAINIFKFQTK